MLILPQRCIISSGVAVEKKSWKKISQKQANPVASLSLSRDWRSFTSRNITHNFIVCDNDDSGLDAVIC